MIGDSRVRGLKELISSSDVSDIWLRPGGRVEDMSKFVDDLTILHQGEDNSRAHFYVWVGICNLTKRLRHSRYEEVIFSKEDADKNREHLRAKIELLAKHIVEQYAAPIFCPIFPMNLKNWNEHRLAQKKTSELRFKEKYNQMQIQLENEVVLFNKFLIHLNVENNLLTPMFNNDFLHNRGKGRVTARYNDLVDGCHPGGKLVLKFKKSFLKALEGNSKQFRH